MSLADLSEEQQRIINCLYNVWHAKPDGIGLSEHQLTEQAKLDINDLLKEVQRLKALGIVDTGYGSDDDRFGRAWLTAYGRSLREE
jgi:DNA-binding MarR family transcriptional regulator